MFSHIYGRVDEINHPLTGLQNWITMYRTFLHDTVVRDEDAAWTAATKHVATSFKPTGPAIKAWMGKMDEKV